MNPTVNAPLLVALLSLLTACGGGGGAAPAPAPGQPPAAEIAQPTRIRAADGFDIQVTPYRMSNAASTAPSRVEIRIVNGADPTQVVALNAWVGQDYDGATVLDATPTGSGVWSLTWPAVVAADSGLLLAVTLKSEDMFETGLTDFQLSR